MSDLILKASSSQSIPKGFRALAEGTLAEIFNPVTSAAANYAVATDSAKRAVPKGYLARTDGTLAINMIVIDAGSAAADLIVSSDNPRNVPLAYRVMPDGSSAIVVAGVTAGTTADLKETAAYPVKVKQGYRSLGNGLFAPIVAVMAAGTGGSDVKVSTTNGRAARRGYKLMADGSHALIVAQYG